MRQEFIGKLFDLDLEVILYFERSYITLQSDYGLINVN